MPEPTPPNVVAGQYGNVWSYFCRDCKHFEQPFDSRNAAIVASMGHVCTQPKAEAPKQAGASEVATGDAS